MSTHANTAHARPGFSDHARHFQLDPNIVFLNHGSFGAVPRVVHEEQARWKAEIELDPVRFFVERMDAGMDAARAALAPVIACDPQDLAFATNATQAVATVLENLRPMLRPGDELLADTHEYPACMNNLQRLADRTGAKVVSAEMPMPIASADQLVDSILSKVTPRTRLAMLSHTTSPSGLVLPIERIVKELEGRGVITLIDGAHGVGFVPLDLPAIGCSFYTSNCHKWLCGPKGSAFLYVRADRRKEVFPGAGDGLRPLSLSNMAITGKPGRSKLHTEFDYVGTADPTPFLALPKAVEFLSTLLPGGIGGVMSANHQLVLKGRSILCSRLGIEPPAPDSMLGALCTLFLPPHTPERAARLAARPTMYADALQDLLLSKWGIQVPVWSAPAGSSNRVVRISAQVYNRPEQYEYLAEALAEELAAERAM
jgi:isopenicillin-N epimerase